MQTFLPAFFFPTETIIIDDNYQFLESLSLSLEYNNISYKFFSNPSLALSYIEENLKKHNWINKYIKSLEEEITDHKVLDINISDLYNELYNKERFNVITNIVVDYDMPIINGLEFCDKIGNTNINKILLTGTVDDKSAINAFNKGLINYFIPKNSDNMYEMLSTCILNGANTYFNNMSQMIYAPIKANNNNSIFENSSFVGLLLSIIQEKNIVEYYLLGETGSYLMLNNTGNISVLHINPEETLDYIYDLAKDEGLNKEILVALQNRSKVLFYFSMDNNKIPDINLWQHYIKTPNVIQINGKNCYYFLEENILSKSSIIDFNQYTRSCNYLALAT
jgi:CheY-like chemotaxis protein